VKVPRSRFQHTHGQILFDAAMIAKKGACPLAVSGIYGATPTLILAESDVFANEKMFCLD
jgi:hypothetical protein